jgi:hypothetical protein
MYTLFLVLGRRPIPAATASRSMGMGPLFILVLAAMARVPYCGGGAMDYGQALSNNISFLEEQQSGVLPGNSVQCPFAKCQQDLGASVRPNPALVSCDDDERSNREQGEASTYNGAPFMAVLAAGHGGSCWSLEDGTCHPRAMIFSQLIYLGRS